MRGQKAAITDGGSAIEKDKIIMKVEMNRQQADSYYQEEVWAVLDEMLGDGFVGRNKQAAAVEAQAAIFAMDLLAERMAPLTGCAQPSPDDIEPLVIDALVRHGDAAKAIVKDWQASMGALRAFVGREFVPVGPEHDTPVMIARILSAVDRRKLGAGEAHLHKALMAAVVNGQILRPGTGRETLVLFIGDAGGAASDLHADARNDGGE